MSRDIPAALASIKRYTPNFLAGTMEQWQGNGRYFRVDDIAQLFAILPPPADGAVAWRYRYRLHADAKWSKWDFIGERDNEKLERMLRDGLTTPDLCEVESLGVVAAPPADSAIKTILDELEAFSAKCWDRADDGALLLLDPKYIARYDELCRQARIALGRPLYGDQGECELDAKEDAERAGQSMLERDLNRAKSLKEKAAILIWHRFGDEYGDGGWREEDEKEPFRDCAADILKLVQP